MILKSEMSLSCTSSGTSISAAKDAIGPNPDLLPDAWCISCPFEVVISLASTPQV